MIRTKEELLKIVADHFGDSPTEEELSIIEDISDTVADMSAAKETDWESKYAELDAAWKKRYMDRFRNGEAAEKIKVEFEVETEPEKEAPTKFEELFEEG